MDLNEALKFVGGLAAVVAAYKCIIELLVGRRARFKEGYRFAKEFLNDLESESMHPLAIERGYYALAGTDSVNPSAVAYVLSLQEPQQQLSDYVVSRTYVEFNSLSHKIEFSQKLKEKISRRVRKETWRVAYCFPAGAAISPFIFYHFSDSGFEVLLYTFITVPVFGFMAVRCLMNYIGIQSAEDLVANQQKRVSLITLNK